MPDILLKVRPVRIGSCMNLDYAHVFHKQSVKVNLLCSTDALKAHFAISKLEVQNVVDDKSWVR